MSVISVIIPNYNHAPYLRWRIDSVLNQSFADFELIILDDLSTDNSREIIESYRANPKVSNIIFNKENSGSTFKQWEKGISIATGEYIWIAESDDYAESNFLESLYNLIKLNPEIGIAYCGSNLSDADEVIIGENARDIGPNKDGYYINNGQAECINYGFWHPTIPNASAVIFKKELYYKVDPSFKNYKICGDWQFWVDVVYNTSVIYLPEKLNYFRQTNTSVSRSTHYINNNYTVFYLERLKIALYGCDKAKGEIPFYTRVKNVYKYLFEVILETSRKRIFLSKEDKLYISKSLFHITAWAPLIFFASIVRVGWFALGTVKRSIIKRFN